MNKKRISEYYAAMSRKEKPNCSVIVCKLKEIKPRASLLRNTISTALDLTAGIFRESKVSLRNCCPRDLQSLRLSEETIERDYEILSKIRHKNIILLMAACFCEKLTKHMTLIFEPVDFTLNYYLHQMNAELSIPQSIYVVKQIASAALYLQNSGYIHSNISSHNILVRRYPFCVKLSSFELTTEMDSSYMQLEILNAYGKSKKNRDTFCSADFNETNEEKISLKERYKEMSKRTAVLKCSPNNTHSFTKMPSKHLVYNVNYREHLAVHNFQAPELLTLNTEFVFPTHTTDVYSLCLLLWELLNKCVPFVVYNRLDLIRMVAKNRLSLPFFERERCKPFSDLFRKGFEIDPEKRLIDIAEMVFILNHIQCKFVDQDYDSSSINENQTKYATPTSFMSPEIQNKVSNVKNVSNEKSPSISSLIDFNRCLSDADRTSTVKKRKKPLRNLTKTTGRELFQDLNSSVSDDHTQSCKLNENLDVIGVSDIISSPSEASHQHNNGRKSGSPLSTVNKVLGYDEDIVNSTTPEVVGFKVEKKSPLQEQQKQRDKSLIPIRTTRLSSSNTAGSTDLSNCNELSNNSKSMNISIGVVHNKVSPKKDNNIANNTSNPSVMSRVQFFNSNNQKCKNDKPLYFDKRSITPVKCNETLSSLNDDSVRQIVNALESEMLNGKKNNSYSNASTLQFHHKTNKDALISDLKKVMSTSHQEPNVLFEHKLWKKQTDTCNKSLGAKDNEDDLNIITPKWCSVRDTILKYEKNSSLLRKKNTFSSIVTNIHKGSIVQNASTLIKPNILQESTSSITKPLFNSPDKKFRPSVTSKAKRSSNVGLNDQSSIAQGPQIYCGNENGLLCFNASQSISGTESSLMAKYVCYTCASQMSTDELKAFKSEPISCSSNEIMSSSELSPPKPRCQALKHSQTIRSIEDLYIDDDFIHGLGANMELQSDNSNFIDFDAI